MDLASSTVEPIGQDLSEIVDVNALKESDKGLQRIGWVNEGIEIVQRRAVPQEGVTGHIVGRVGRCPSPAPRR